MDDRRPQTNLYPQVIGIDIANIQPRQYADHDPPDQTKDSAHNILRRIPPNVTFQIPCNFEGLWTHGQDSFDVIHLQMLTGSVASWPRIYSNVFS